ncbi:MAG: ABC transporter ATP-binding protein [Candidatus Binatia bacterium]
MAALVKIRGLVKNFGGVQAVNSLDLEIQEGEFFTLLGPSGCGKTTTLRLLAGLEKADAGEITMGERCLVSAGRGVFVQPEKREMGMVFQSYAVWPHMTVFENVAYPLKLRRVKRSAILEKVREALSLVGLEGLEDRPAPALSGGQQQRVALARALVFSPRVLLLDEPLSNLDARLRDEMRQELKSLQRRVGVTVLFVTHDQVEGLSLSDRIAIMNAGHLEQVGRPEEVYNYPLTSFARDFLGQTFALPGKVLQAADNGLTVELNGIAEAPLRVQHVYASSSEDHFVAGRELMLAIRPEQISVFRALPQGKSNIVPTTVEDVRFLGDRYEYTISLGKEKRVLLLPGSETLRTGEKVFLEFTADKITLWPR